MERSWWGLLRWPPWRLAAQDRSGRSRRHFKETQCRVNMTPVRVNMTTVSVEMTPVSVNVTGVSVRMTGVSANMTAVILNMTGVSVKMTAVRLNVTAVILKGAGHLPGPPLPEGEEGETRRTRESFS